MGMTSQEKEELRVKIGDELFWRKVRINSETGCWEWQGCVLSDGYGRVSRNGKTMLAHHFLLERKPDWAKGEECCHRCDNRVCVRPDHIFIGSRSDNQRDCVRKGRHGGVPANCRPKQYFRGEENHWSKLTEAQAKQIKFRPQWEKGDIAKIAREFGVSETAITSIRDGRTWKWL